MVVASSGSVGGRGAGVGFVPTAALPEGEPAQRKCCWIEKALRVRSSNLFYKYNFIKEKYSFRKWKDEI